MTARRILVKVGGETLRHLGDRQRLVSELLKLHQTGAQICVVHGGGPQITALGDRLGLQSLFAAGRRVTDAAMIQAVAMALCGEVGPQLLAACTAAGLPAVTTCAASGGCVVGRKRPPRAVAGHAEPVDFGLVADIVEVQPQLLLTLWQSGFVPLLSPLVADAEGQLLNLNADSLVTGLTTALKFDDVVLVTGVPGVYRDLADPLTHIPDLVDSEIAQLIADGAITGGMIAKLEEVKSILVHGANAVWIVGYKEPGSLSSALGTTDGSDTRLRTVVRRG